MNQNVIIHVVEPGDTLYSLAKSITRQLIL